MFVVLGHASITLSACSDGAQEEGDGNSGTKGGIDTTGRSFNECGVAAPLPAETGQ